MELVMITSESCVRRKLFTGFGHSWFRLSYLVLPILPAHDCLCDPSLAEWVQSFENASCLPCKCVIVHH